MTDQPTNPTETQEDIEAARKKKDEEETARTQACLEEITKSLEKYNCFTDVEVVVSASGTTRGRFIVKAR